GEVVGQSHVAGQSSGSGEEPCFELSHGHDRGQRGVGVAVLRQAVYLGGQVDGAVVVGVQQDEHGGGRRLACGDDGECLGERFGFEHLVARETVGGLDVGVGAFAEVRDEPLQEATESLLLPVALYYRGDHRVGAGHLGSPSCLSRGKPGSGRISPLRRSSGRVSTPSVSRRRPVSSIGPMVLPWPSSLRTRRWSGSAAGLSRRSALWVVTITWVLCEAARRAS